MSFRIGRWGRPASVLMVLSTVALLVAAVVVATSGPPPLPRPPRLGSAKDIYDGDFGDPFVLPVASTPGEATAGYVLFGTDDPPDHVPTARSDDLNRWQHGPDAVPVVPAWANPDSGASLTWAPAVLAVASGYLMYVSVQEADSRRECIAALSATRPERPYRDALGSALVCQRDLGGSIDPSATRDAQGAVHLVWKSDGNCCGLQTSLWEEDLGPDGLRVTGSPHRLLTADRAWQGGIVENPALTPASGGGWWLFYSGNRFDTAAYATGLAYCRSLISPCRETSRRPLLTGTGSQFSPGGLDFFTDGHGALWASFATWNRPARNGRFYCCRSLDIARVLVS